MKLQCVPITDGDEKVFGGRGEKLKVSDVQLLHLDGLTELDDEPEREREKQGFKSRLQVEEVKRRNYLRMESRRYMHATYQILLLQGFSMYKSMFSINMAEVLCVETDLQINKQIPAADFSVGLFTNYRRLLIEERNQKIFTFKKLE